MEAPAVTWSGVDLTLMPAERRRLYILFIVCPGCCSAARRHITLLRCYLLWTLTVMILSADHRVWGFDNRVCIPAALGLHLWGVALATDRTMMSRHSTQTHSTLHTTDSERARRTNTPSPSIIKVSSARQTEVNKQLKHSHVYRL